jgi:RNase P/RNase MRP subunit p29
MRQKVAIWDYLGTDFRVENEKDLHLGGCSGVVADFCSKSLFLPRKYSFFCP